MVFSFENCSDIHTVRKIVSLIERNCKFEPEAQAFAKIMRLQFRKACADFNQVDWND